MIKAELGEFYYVLGLQIVLGPTKNADGVRARGYPSAR